MKAVILILPLFTVLVFTVRGQEPCTPGALAQRAGSLRASKIAGSTYGLTAAEVARARAMLTRVHQAIAAGYKPVGVVGDYSYHFSSGAMANTFGYSLYMLKYNCDPGSGDPTRSYIGTDTPTVVRVDANIINPLSLSAVDTTDNTFRGYMFMRSLPKRIGDFYYLGDNPAGNARAPQKEYTWLVTYDDQLPFTPMTRKEFLVLTKARLEKTKSENGSSGGFYDHYVNRVNEHLKRSDAELSPPAIINRMDEERFAGFAEEGAPGAYYAIRHNPAYYRKGTAKSAAQFFTVVYSVYESDPVYFSNIEEVKKALDLDLLRSMLGK